MQMSKSNCKFYLIPKPKSNLFEEEKKLHTFLFIKVKRVQFHIAFNNTYIYSFTRVIRHSLPIFNLFVIPLK